MSEAQRELDRRLEVIMARLHRDPAVRAELALREVKADPAGAALLEQAAQDAGAKSS
jgi:hypothetical protein